jgi:hypothetical protein
VTYAFETIATLNKDEFLSLHKTCVNVCVCVCVCVSLSLSLSVFEHVMVLHTHFCAKFRLQTSKKKGDNRKLSS